MLNSYSEDFEVPLAGGGSIVVRRLRCKAQNRVFTETIESVKINLDEEENL